MNEVECLEGDAGSENISAEEKQGRLIHANKVRAAAPGSCQKAPDGKWNRLQLHTGYEEREGLLYSSVH